MSLPGTDGVYQGLNSVTDCNSGPDDNVWMAFEVAVFYFYTRLVTVCNSNAAMGSDKMHDNPSSSQFERVAKLGSP